MGDTSRLYVGLMLNGVREVFRSKIDPTAKSHPQYAAAIGPFRTRAGAEVMRDRGFNNPHVRSVADAERIATLL